MERILFILRPLDSVLSYDVRGYRNPGENYAAILRDVQKTYYINDISAELLDSVSKQPLKNVVVCVSNPVDMLRVGKQFWRWVSESRISEVVSFNSFLEPLIASVFGQFNSGGPVFHSTSKPLCSVANRVDMVTPYHKILLFPDFYELERAAYVYNRPLAFVTEPNTVSSFPGMSWVDLTTGFGRYGDVLRFFGNSERFVESLPGLKDRVVGVRNFLATVRVTDTTKEEAMADAILAAMDSVKESLKVHIDFAWGGLWPIASKLLPIEKAGVSLSVAESLKMGYQARCLEMINEGISFDWPLTLEEFRCGV